MLCSLTTNYYDHLYSVKMATISKSNSHDKSDLVAYWNIPLADGLHTIEFEHGTTTGKRVLRVDGEEIVRRDWMFKLVGEERFKIGKQETKCELRVDPLPYFAFSYSLIVDGKPFEKFSENQSRALRSWAILLKGQSYRVVLEKQTLDVWVNGQCEEAEHTFVKDGTEINFTLGECPATIKACSADKKQGVLHQLYLDGRLFEEDTTETAAE